MSRHRVMLGAAVFVLSDHQLRVLHRAVHCKAIHVSGADVRAARDLASYGFGTLTDDGALGPTRQSNADGERWTFTLADVLIQAAP